MFPASHVSPIMYFSGLEYRPFHSADICSASALPEKCIRFPLPVRAGLIVASPAYIISGKTKIQHHAIRKDLEICLPKEWRRLTASHSPVKSHNDAPHMPRSFMPVITDKPTIIASGAKAIVYIKNVSKEVELFLAALAIFPFVRHRNITSIAPAANACDPIKWAVCERFFKKLCAELVRLSA